MNDDLRQMNIPNISVPQVTKRLEELFCAAVEKKIPFRNIPTPFLWGPAGIGKSEGVYALAESIGKKNGEEGLGDRRQASLVFPC